MDNKTIFTKTTKGLGEALGKTKALSRDFRNILKEIDGKASVEQLQSKLDYMAEAKLQDALAILAGGDYIREFASQEVAVDDELDFTLDASPDDALTALTMGAFLRELSAPGDSELASNTIQKKARIDEILAKERLEPRARKDAEELAIKKAIEQVRRDAEEKARRVAEAQARREAEGQARKETAEQARREAEQAARREAEAQARKAAEEQARKEAAERARREAEQEARREAEMQARKAAEEQARKDAAEQARRELEQAAGREAEERTRKEVEERTRKEEDERTRKEAEERARRESEAQVIRLAEEEARQQAEIQARNEAGTKARMEAEQQARQEIDEKARRKAVVMQIRRDAIEKYKRDADERARKEAEDKLGAAAEDQARLEAEQQARVEAEQQALREADEQARREAELRARRKAEEDARQRAEQQVRHEEEQRAQRDAEEQAQKEAEENIRLNAEAQARLEADQEARREAEEAIRIKAERVRRENEERASKQAEQQAKKLAEREVKAQARLAAEAQARNEAEQRARDKAAEKARREAEKQAERDVKEAKVLLAAEARAQRNAEKRSKTDEPETLGLDTAQATEQGTEELTPEHTDDKTERPTAREARVQAEREAEQEADHAAILEIARAAAVDKGDGKHYRQPIRWGAYGVLLFFSMIAVGLVLLQIMSFDKKASLFEKMAAAQFRQPVSIGRVSLALLPQPHWRLAGVSVGKDAQIKVSQIDATAEFDTLFSDKIVFKSIALSAPVMNEEGLGWLLFGKSEWHDLTLRELRASNAKLDTQKIGLPAFDAKVEIGVDGKWQKATLDAVDRKTHIELQPHGDTLQVEMTADAFPKLFGSLFPLGKVDAKGTASRHEVTLTQFNGILYDGVISGYGKLKWANGWSLSGELTARQINAAQLAPQLLESGTLEATATYALLGQTADRMFAAPRLRGTANIRNGVLLGVDLAGLLRNHNGGGKSSFAELGSGFSFEGGMLQLRNTHLGAGLVSASGAADLDAGDKLSGRFTVDLDAPSHQAHANLALSGTLEKPRFSR